jgi:hypothetical protein
VGWVGLILQLSFCSLCHILERERERERERDEVELMMRDTDRERIKEAREATTQMRM